MADIRQVTPQYPMRRLYFFDRGSNEFLYQYDNGSLHVIGRNMSTGIIPIEDLVIGLLNECENLRYRVKQLEDSREKISDE